MSNEVNARIRKARITFANLRHLWRQKSLSLSLKARVYQATVRAVLLYGCETWANRVQDLRKLQVFDNRCLRTIAGFGWYEKIRNTDVHRRIFGSAANHSLGNIIRRSQLRWLGHVLRMPNHRLPKRALLSVPHPEWRKSIGGQRSTWLKEIKQITKSLGGVGAARLPGWGPPDPPTTWLETLGDMASNRNQWRTCCQSLAGVHE